MRFQANDILVLVGQSRENRGIACLNVTGKMPVPPVLVRDCRIFDCELV